jgi:hypothetical protein
MLFGNARFRTFYPKSLLSPLKCFLVMPDSEHFPQNHFRAWNNVGRCFKDDIFFPISPKYKSNVFQTIRRSEGVWLNQHLTLFPTFQNRTGFYRWRHKKLRSFPAPFSMTSSSKDFPPNWTRDFFPPGVNLMITIFLNFRRKKICRFSSKPMSSYFFCKN